MGLKRLNFNSVPHLHFCSCSGCHLDEARFLSEYCQHKDPCYVGYCLSGGECTVSVAGVPRSPSCVCPLGFTGQRCEIQENSTCFPNNPCTNGGKCSLLPNDQYKCQCARGWTGQRCEQEDTCLSSPCANGGICNALPNREFSCTCPPGYHGPLCLNDTDECAFSPSLCKNEGMCLNTPGSYRCTCQPGFTGLHCETDYVPCFPSPCLNGGTCRQMTDTTYICHCLPGFNGTNCEVNIDDCPNHRCQNGATCMDGVNTYNCQCPPEWTGQFCTDDVDECRLQPNACLNGGTCSNTRNGYNCVCVNGWSGPDCSENIDDCAAEPCTAGSTCIDRVASFSCSCPPGKTGLLCHIDDACTSNPCKMGAQCYTNPINGKFNCNCPSGYKGSTCAEDIDECVIGPNPCEHGGSCKNTEGSFTCNCAPGYTGPRCEQHINECGSNPCQNDATCLDQIGDYTCICMPGTYTHPLTHTVMRSMMTLFGLFIVMILNLCVLTTGFSGEMCQVDIDECASTPCHNGAKCLDRPNGYECECAEGFTGTLCTDNINDCEPKPCHHGDCIDGIATFTCECHPGYMGPICSEQIRECQSDPCQNRGRCVDLVNMYQCNCQPGTSGVNCEINHDDCASNPCQHGTCEDGINEYKCLCKPGYTGERCNEEINECSSNPCLSGGTCVDKVNGFQCLCPVGTHSPLCHSGADHCSPMPCLHGECIEKQNGYLCSCKPGWEGKNCEREKNECQINPCQNGGTCNDRLNGYTCVCARGFSGLNCEININECESNPCMNQGTCVDRVNSYICHCTLPYTGRHCEDKLVPCDSQPCKRRGVCQPSLDYTSYTCLCHSGWEGKCFEFDVDECKKNPCQNGGHCRNTVGSYRCECQPGYSGVNCQTNIDDCSSNPCRNGGTCFDKVGRYLCECRAGFYGERCEEEVDECASNPCWNGGRCTDYVNSYTCQCPPGYDGINCERDVPDCTETYDFHINYPGILLFHCIIYMRVAVDMVCKHAGRCIDKDNTHQCMCQIGYMGSYCEDEVDECRSSPCRNGGTCVDYQSGYDCKCKAGYQGVNCEYDVDECQSNPCRNGGTCIDLINRFSCACPPGTKGLQCEVNVNECAPEFGARCKNGGQCVDGVGRYTCSCPPGFTGEHCEGDVNECLSGPCHPSGTIDCVPLTNNYQCRCRLGYTGQHCELMVDLCQSKPCHNNGRCAMNTSLLHGYTCTCQPGYTGFNCGDFEIFTCASLRCQNGGQCVEIKGRPQCRCPMGFTGPHCESITNRCMCQNGGKCMPDNSNKFSCQCPPGFSGPTCQVYKPSCLYSECEQRAGDKVCDPQCRTPECEWDGGDCTLHWDKPWKNCTASVPCWELFHNGRCDPECDNAGCLFDSFECQKGSSTGPSTCKYEKYCADHYANGHCNQGCNTEACGWDGLDCATDTPPKLADGTLVIVVLLQPEELLGDLKGFLRSLGTLLHTNLRIKLDEHKRPMVYPYYGNEEDEIQDNIATMKQRGKRELEREVIGYVPHPEMIILLFTFMLLCLYKLTWFWMSPWFRSKVHLEIDNRQCSQHLDECISSADQAAAFIAAEYLTSELPYPVYSVDSPGPHMPPLLYLVAVAAAIILLILVLGVLAAKRKRKHGTLWLPDGFLAKKDSKRREPVGQDDFGMNMQKPQDGGLMDGSSTHHWSEEDHLSKKPRMEDKPLLPVGVDGGVDRREWTLQHHKAADITLTPPQADIDMDSLDVNVKGPDGFTPLMLASLRSGSSPDCGSMLGDEEEESGADEPGTNVITDLIGQGASLNAQTDRTGETALHLAARYARADAAKRLLDAGADANAHDNMGRTPLHAAVAADAQGVFQILIRNRATDLDARMNDGTTPLILAARLAVEGMVEELVHCHADVNAVDDHGKSALHWAAAVNNVDATLVLLKNGANRDMQDNKEETPLFLAAREGSFEAAQVLLDHYSNRDITDHLDRLPRDTAQERMHHDIVRLLDQYNLVHSPHSGPNHVGNGGGHSSMVCGTNGTGFMIGMRPGPQGKKNRRAGGKANTVAAGTAKDLKEMKTKSGNVTKAAGGLSESSVTMSPVDSLESPHSYAGEAVATTSTANSPPLLSTPSVRPMLPPVSHMLSQQQSWVSLAKHSYNGHMFGLMQPQQMNAGHTSMQQHHSPGMLTPMNVTMSREQLPPIVTFQMMSAGNGQSLLKQAQQGQMQAQGQNQAQSQHLHCNQSMMYPMPNVGMQHGLSHTLTHPHGHNHTLPHGLPESQAQQVASYQPRKSPVDKYPTPPSQHSYPNAGSEGTTPGHPARNPSEHPYLTPSPESPDPWSSSSPHSNSDWSDVTTSPTPLGHPHTLPPSCHTHIPEQAQLQPPSQAAQPSQSQQSQRSSVYA
uniref:Notch receptor 2 n=1 Tax=Cyprinus carpio TaxID=7962 RepID=A0A8C2GDN5_CYPCA